MQIPLLYRDSGGDFPELVKAVFLNPPNTHSFATSEFIVDTGSHKSMINPTFAQQLDMPTTKMNFKENTYIGGSTVKTAQVDNIEVRLRAKDDNVFKTRHNFLVGSYHGKQAADIGCILGMDFIVSQGLNLIVKNKQNSIQAYLES